MDLNIKKFDRFKDKLKVKFHSGVPGHSFLKHFFNVDECNPMEFKIIIFDDLMSAVNKKAGDILTAARHSNISVISLEQSTFCDGKDGPTFRRNMHIKVIFPFKQDLNSVKLTKQKSIGDGKKVAKLMEIYKDIISKDPHGYLVLDLNNKGNPLLMIRTNILVHLI